MQENLDCFHLKMDKNIILVQMKSPKGHDYKFSLERTTEHLKLMKSKDRKPMLLTILKEMKAKGLKPLQVAVQTNKPKSQSEAIVAVETQREVDVSGEPNNNAEQADVIDEASMLMEKSVSKQCTNTADSLKKGQAKKRPRDLRVDDILDNDDLIFNVERMILEEVLKRPPLFDITLPFKDKTPDLIYSLFLEISTMIDEEYQELLTAKVVENTWNYHRALYFQFKNSPGLPSGSGARKQVLPAHYITLQQLDVVGKRRKQISTTSAEGFKLYPPSKKGKERQEVDVLLKNASKYLGTLNTSTNVTKFSATHRDDVTDRSLSSSVNYDTDVDRAFFASLLPDFKKQSQRQQRELKIKLLETINLNLNQNEDECNTQAA